MTVSSKQKTNIRMALRIMDFHTVWRLSSDELGQLVRVSKGQHLGYTNKAGKSGGYRGVTYT